MHYQTAYKVAMHSRRLLLMWLFHLSRSLELWLRVHNKERKCLLASVSFSFRENLWYVSGSGYFTIPAHVPTNPQTCPTFTALPRFGIAPAPPPQLHSTCLTNFIFVQSSSLIKFRIFHFWIPDICFATQIARSTDIQFKFKLLNVCALLVSGITIYKKKISLCNRTSLLRFLRLCEENVTSRKMSRLSTKQKVA